MIMTSQLPITPHSQPAPAGALPVPVESLARRARRVVVALPDSPLKLQLLRLFQQCGFEVHVAAPDHAARRLARDLKPRALVLPVETEGESGWLTCAKLLWAHPNLRVVLVGRSATARDERFRRFVGAAALVPEVAGAQAVLDAVLTA
jgi:hypothetical protein